MFMMSKKRKKSVAVVVSLVLAIGFLFSIVVGLFSGYNL